MPGLIVRRPLSDVVFCMQLNITVFQYILLKFLLLLLFPLPPF